AQRPGAPITLTRSRSPAHILEPFSRGVHFRSELPIASHSIGSSRAASTRRTRWVLEAARFAHRHVTVTPKDRKPVFHRQLVCAVHGAAHAKQRKTGSHLQQPGVLLLGRNCFEFFFRPVELHTVDVFQGEIEGLIFEVLFLKIREQSGGHTDSLQPYNLLVGGPQTPELVHFLTLGEPKRARGLRIRITNDNSQHPSRGAQAPAHHFLSEPAEFVEVLDDMSGTDEGSLPF